MKSHFLIISLALLLSACGNTDERMDGVRPDISIMQAKLNGTLIEAVPLGPGIIELANPNPDSANVYVFTLIARESGTDYNYLILSLSITEEVIPGYYISEEDCNAKIGCPTLGYVDTQSGEELTYSSEYSSGNCQLTISEINYEPGGRLRGSFSGTVIDNETGVAIEISEGTFDTFFQ